MENKIRKLLFLFFIFCFLSGCATTGTVSAPRMRETVVIDGARYITLESFARSYNLDYSWDPIAHKVTIKNMDKELVLMAGSSVVLLNNQAQTMDKEAKFYQARLAIPQSFVYRRLVSFFTEEYIAPKAAVPSSFAPLGIRKIIIDPGHGGKDPGAVGRGGLKEKDIVLDIAKRLERKLRASGINVILTRDRDTFISLEQRSDIANSKDVDCFISIHANASRSRWASGVEVFYLSEAIDDNLRSFNAAQNFNLNLQEGYSGQDTPAILWDLIYSDNRKSSIQLADFVCKSLSRQLYQKSRGTKPARFSVLKGTNIPAVLIEVGFISNPRDEKKLREDAYRDEITQAVYEGIIQYDRKFAPKRTARY